MRRRAWGGWRGVAGALVAAIFAVPLALMVSGSFRRPGEPPPKTLELLPDRVSLGSYGRAFDLVDLARHALNSLLVVAVAVPLTVLVASWAGFALSQLRGRVESFVVALSFAALMVPTTALLVPRFASTSAASPSGRSGARGCRSGSPTVATPARRSSS